eukprot:CAMPEP_0202451512 /NCGR_PEP_ID=MMETSP1360-20130828/9933_1 /ASSEMBLY_ACC=CAM_ASM_000848 /TAXON_ID=515479 /ORGANISM="Licmophora paradoxa, Strain CCMP2313" /LENGTH=282 /DNA_ID=CAMNT_0049070097 /DNA_START=463 /DNA_END=1311 /DNA_ORIENTATION=-
MICLAIWCRRRIATDNDLPGLQEMERNIQEFARQQEARKRTALTKALEKGRLTLTEAHLSPDKSGYTAITDCSICLLQYQPGDKIVRSPNPQCAHVFHEDCIVTWLCTRTTPACPCCRQIYILNNSVPPTRSAGSERPEEEGCDTGENEEFVAAIQNDTSSPDAIDVEMGITGRIDVDVVTDSATDSFNSDGVDTPDGSPQSQMASDSDRECSEETSPSICGEECQDIEVPSETRATIQSSSSVQPSLDSTGTASNQLTSNTSSIDVSKKEPPELDGETNSN